jgi:glycosyltransferase involved in cell wall biosynthesis
VNELSGNLMTFATALDYPDDSRYAARAHVLTRDLPNSENLAGELRRFCRVLRAASKEDVLLVESASGRWNPDLLATAIVGTWPKRFRPIVVLMGAMWEPDRGLRHRIERLIVKLADRAIRLYAVQSSEELRIFPAIWDVAPSKMRFCPYFFTLTARDLAVPAPSSGDHVFAGGNAHRDYEALLDAARSLPERRFVFATRYFMGSEDLPPNVNAGPVSREMFFGLMRSASAVVVPIRGGLHRAAGQQTYLNAMWLGKPTIVPDTLGVRDHVENYRTGLIVDGSPEDYTKALRWVFDPARQSEVATMCAQAHKVVSEQFAFENHVTHLLGVLDEATGSS